MKVVKFKAAEEPTQKDVVLSVERDQEGHTIALVVRSPLTLLVTYQALVIPGKAQVDSFMGKQQNARINAWRSVGGKFRRELIKLQVRTILL